MVILHIHFNTMACILLSSLYAYLSLPVVFIHIIEWMMSTLYRAFCVSVCLSMTRSPFVLARFRAMSIFWHGFVLLSRCFQKVFARFRAIFYVFIKLYFFALPDGAVCVLACVPRALLCLCRSVHLPSLSPIAPSVPAVSSAAVGSVAPTQGERYRPLVPPFSTF